MLDQKVIELKDKGIELLKSRVAEMEKRATEMAIWAYTWGGGTLSWMQRSTRR